MKLEDIFKIKTEDDGKVYIVRPLPNVKEVPKNQIVAYKAFFSQLSLGYRYLCYALVDDVLRIFDFSEQIHKYFIETVGTPETNMVMMNSDSALKITVGTKAGFLKNEYEVLHDDKYKFDTEEKKKFISIRLLHTELDLSEALKLSDDFAKELREKTEQTEDKLRYK